MNNKIALLTFLAFSPIIFSTTPAYADYRIKIGIPNVVLVDSTPVEEPVDEPADKCPKPSNKMPTYQNGFPMVTKDPANGLARYTVRYNHDGDNSSLTDFHNTSERYVNIILSRNEGNSFNRDAYLFPYYDFWWDVKDGEQINLVVRMAVYDKEAGEICNYGDEHLILQKTYSQLMNE